MIRLYLRPRTGAALLVLSLLLVAAVYWPGLSGGWLFDDYPNIVDNHGVQPANANLPSLLNAALSSPSSELKRPLASLSFAANYLATGLNPFGWKLTNLLIHLLNGLLVFWLARALLQSVLVGAHPVHKGLPSVVRESSFETSKREPSRTGCAPTRSSERAGVVAALIATGWMLLPINLTGVLYVVQRMESMANLFVLLGLIGYTSGRRRMLGVAGPYGLVLCVSSLVVPTLLGVLAKETAVMLPLYALLIEWMLFHFRGTTARRDWRIIGSFVIFLVLPMLIGLAWLLPELLKPEAWAARDFTMSTRLLSEARIVVDYIRWSLLPTPRALSFYHDDFRISTGLLSPWSTLASLIMLVVLTGAMLWLRPRRPLAALGIALFLGCHLLTGTILSLELIYEHRNYFASFGLLLAVVPVLAVPRSLPVAWLRYVVLAGLLLYWTTLTTMTAYAWGDPLRLAQELAARAPDSPRAQYELGRTYIIYSHYDPASPYTQLAYAPLEKAASFPESSILPQQALIFMNSRMQLPLKDAWWDSMIAKLKAREAGVQDESSLAALTQCARERRCGLPAARMTSAFEAAISHAQPSARLLATYGDYAWNVLGNRKLGESMTARAVQAAPDESAYQITLARMMLALGRDVDARQIVQRLRVLNLGGRLDSSIAELESEIAVKAMSHEKNI